ncbi:transposon Tf2-9 polyprotein [Trichonephila clavipes]|nr:transposon Tf2-9 polyprotein [Trichonephila clavipes]
MITNFFIPKLNNHDVQELWFQQDGATCHTARATIDLLKDTFGDRLISRFGPVNWPPRSCDLTPLDYFLWGYVKLLVYAYKPQTLDHLEDNIRRVIADIWPQMLEKVIENWTSRLDYIRASRGSPMPEIIFKMIESISEIDYDKIADAQVDNEELNKLRLCETILKYPLDSGKLLWCDISTANIRPFIPQPLRMHMFQKIHNLAHPGVKSTVKQIASRFIWLNIRKDVNQWAKSCIQCQKNKINRHTHSQIGTFQEVDDRFSVIHVDIIGTFPVSEGKINCLTCIDRFTCWIEVIP